jgi:hypothetical protein
VLEIGTAVVVRLPIAERQALPPVRPAA